MIRSLRIRIDSSRNVIPVPKKYKRGLGGLISELDDYEKRRLRRALRRQRESLGKDAFNAAVWLLAGYAQEWREGLEYKPTAENLAERVRIVGETYAKGKSPVKFEPYVYDRPIPGLREAYVATRTEEGLVNRALNSGIKVENLWEFHRVYLNRGKIILELAEAVKKKYNPNAIINRFFRNGCNYDLDSILDLIKITELRFDDILKLGDSITERAAVEKSASGDPIERRYKIIGVPADYNSAPLQTPVLDYASVAGLNEARFDASNKEVIVTGREANLQYFELIVLRKLSSYNNTSVTLQLQQIAPAEKPKPVLEKAYVA